MNSAFLDTVGWDRAFVLVTGAVGVLILLSILFAALTLVLRLRNDREAARWGRLEAEWVPPLLDILAGDAPPERLTQRVRRADRRRFVSFLLRYIHRIQGDELAAIRTLARPFLDHMAKRARRGSPEGRATAVRALARLGLPEHEDVLLEALDDPAPLIATVAARSLAEWGGPSYAPRILDRLEAHDLSSTGALAEIMATIGPGVVPHLLASYGDTHATAELRAVCAEALAQLDAVDAADAAAHVLRETRADLAAAAPATSDVPEVTLFGDRRELLIATLKLVARVGGPRHLEYVRGLVRSEDPVVRALAVSALGTLGERHDLPHLVAALSDPSPWVALRAARALERRGETDPLEALATSDADRATLAREVLGR